MDKISSISLTALNPRKEVLDEKVMSAASEALGKISNKSY